MKSALEDKVAKMEARAERDLSWAHKAHAKCAAGSEEQAMAAALIAHLEGFLATIRTEREIDAAG